MRANRDEVSFVGKRKMKPISKMAPVKTKAKDNNSRSTTERRHKVDIPAGAVN